MIPAHSRIHIFWRLAAIAAIALVVVAPVMRPDLMNVETALRIACALLVVAGYDLATSGQRIDPAHVVYFAIGASVGAIAPDHVGGGPVWGLFAPVAVSILVATAVWGLTRRIEGPAFTLLSVLGLALFCLIALPEISARDMSEAFSIPATGLPAGISDQHVPVILAVGLVGLAMLCRPQQPIGVPFLPHVIGAVLSAVAGIIWAVWGPTMALDATSLAIASAALLFAVHLGGAGTVYGPVLVSAILMAAAPFMPVDIPDVQPAHGLALAGCALAIVALVLPRRQS